MSSHKTEGRMIKKAISDSKGFASLSPKSAVLFCMIIPHLNSYGKMNGGPGYVKDEVCPRVKYLTLEQVKSSLSEISKKTSVKWFEFDDRMWLHSVNFLKSHQKLNVDRLGKDLLPNYSGVTCELRIPEVEVEVEVEVEDNTSPPSGAGEYTEEFNKFWSAYPRKVQKGAASKAWKKNKISNGKLSLILDALEWQRKTEDWTKNNGQFIPYPATYLNSSQWEDEPATATEKEDRFEYAARQPTFEEKMLGVKNGQ